MLVKDLLKKLSSSELQKIKSFVEEIIEDRIFQMRLAKKDLKHPTDEELKSIFVSDAINAYKERTGESLEFSRRIMDEFWPKLD